MNGEVRRSGRVHPGIPSGSRSGRTIMTTESEHQDAYREDFLGPGYDVRSLPLRPDDEGQVVATLVRSAVPGGSRRAVLYVHGFVDYFFQTNLAEAWREAGFDF